MLRRSNSTSRIPLPTRDRSRSRSSTRTTTTTKDTAPSGRTTTTDRASRPTLMKRSMSSSALKKSTLFTRTSVQPGTSGTYHRRGTGTSTTGSANKERTINDKKWVMEQHSKVCMFFLLRPDLIESHVIENLNPPSIGSFVQVINILLKCLDPRTNVTKANYKEVVMAKMKMLRYPRSVSNSMLKTVNTSHSWPHVISMLGWLVDLVVATEKAQSTPTDDNIKNQSYDIKQEFEVHLHLVEAESTLAGLLENRATLQEQLDKLRQNPEPNLTQIKGIEEDIELRSVQIQDLQQKLLDSNEESRKSKLDNIQTMAESKFALKTLMEQAVEIKKNEIAMKAKLIESQATQNELKNKISKLEKIIKMMELKHAEDVSRVQKEYEEKIAVLLPQLRGVQVNSADEELRQELGQGASKDTQGFKTPSVENRKNEKLKIRKEIIDVENQDIEDTDDIEKDPDWMKTPIGKWILERKRNLLQRSILEGEDIGKSLFKGTSNGSCTCLKSNCSSRCGCRKMKRVCSSACKCCPSNCMNRE